MKSWRIYGPTDGNGSWVRVAKGLYEGLLGTQNGSVHFFPYDNVGHDLDTPILPGADAEVGVYVGPPVNARLMRGHGVHKHRWLMLAPNSTWLPTDVMAQLEATGSITGYLSPSAWGKEIIERYAMLPVHVWRHGVSHALTRACAKALTEERLENRSVPRNRFKLLHLSSTQFERKSTHMLVEAFLEWAKESVAPLDQFDAHHLAGCELHIVVDGATTAVEEVAMQTGRRLNLMNEYDELVQVHPRKNLDFEQLARFYREHDFVIQPSRSEGFGMVPLEARACGIPVIMTDGTGHDEHVPLGNRKVAPPAWSSTHTSGLVGEQALHEPARDVHVARDQGVVAIRVEGEAPIDDGVNALAPTVSKERLKQALDAAYDQQPALYAAAHACRLGVGQVWSWDAQTISFVHDLESR